MHKLYFLVLLMCMVTSAMAQISVHNLGIGIVHIGKSSKDYPFLTSVKEAIFSKEYIFTGNVQDYYYYDINHLDNDLPLGKKNIFIYVDAKGLIQSITIFLESDLESVKNYLVRKLGQYNYVGSGGALQIGYRNHYLWNEQSNILCSSDFSILKCTRFSTTRIAINQFDDLDSSEVPSIYIR